MSFVGLDIYCTSKIVWWLFGTYSGGEHVLLVDWVKGSEESFWQMLLLLHSFLWQKHFVKDYFMLLLKKEKIILRRGTLWCSVHIWTFNEKYSKKNLHYFFFLLSFICLWMKCNEHMSLYSKCICHFLILCTAFYECIYLFYDWFLYTNVLFINYYQFIIRANTATNCFTYENKLKKS